jgi:hypothetical protein
MTKCPSEPFENATELLFVDGHSDYGKAIQNRRIMRMIAKFRSFERWKKTYPKEFLQLLSWFDDEVSESRFRQEFPNVLSPTVKKITTLLSEIDARILQLFKSQHDSYLARIRIQYQRSNKSLGTTRPSAIFDFQNGSEEVQL